MISVTAGRYLVFGVVLAALSLACSDESPESHTAGPVVLLKSKPQPLSEAERRELGFPPDLIVLVEKAAGARAEPFFETLLLPAQNLRGKSKISKKRLAGFSVRTAKPYDVISAHTTALRSRGYVIFRSEHNYGTVPDVVTVIKSRSQYDILKVQKTEAPKYRLDTKAIIRWLRREHRRRPFMITGAGATWVEARFVKPPKNVNAFARRVSRFAPDVVNQGSGSIRKLARTMKETNAFYLWWD